MMERKANELEPEVSVCSFKVLKEEFGEKI